MMILDLAKTMLISLLSNPSFSFLLVLYVVIKIEFRDFSKNKIPK